MEDEYLDKLEERLSYDKALAKAKGDAFIEGFTCGGVSMLIVLVAMGALGALIFGSLELMNG